MSTLTVNPKSTSSLAGRSLVSRLIIGNPLVAFFVIAFAGTWLCIAPLALSSGVNGLGLLPYVPSEAMLGILVTLSAFAGPALASFVVTAITLGRPGVKALLRSCVQWRAGIQWYLLIVFGPLLFYLIGFGIVYGTNLVAALLNQWTLLFTLYLPATLFSLITANFAEEVGWRGFAMPRLQRAYGPIYATIILGALHSLWHLPLFFTTVLGPTNPLDFAGFIATGISLTFLYTWVFNHTEGSVLLAALLHAFSNGAIGLAATLIPANLIINGWAAPLVYGGWKGDILFCVGSCALLLIVLTRGRLGYTPENQSAEASVEMIQKAAIS